MTRQDRLTESGEAWVIISQAGTFVTDNEGMPALFGSPIDTTIPGERAVRVRYEITEIEED